MFSGLRGGVLLVVANGCELAMCTSAAAKKRLGGGPSECVKIWLLLLPSLLVWLLLVVAPVCYVAPLQLCAV